MQYLYNILAEIDDSKAEELVCNFETNEVDYTNAILEDENFFKISGETKEDFERIVSNYLQNLEFSELKIIASPKNSL